MKINFDDLKVNLYELLEVQSNSSLVDIKDSYKKLIIKYHPDKNPNIDPDFFSLISVAYKVLKKADTRFKYDNYLINKTNKVQNFNELQQNYKTFMTNNSVEDKPLSGIDNKSSSKQNFHQQMEELNKKHNYVDNLDERSITSKLAEIEKQRSNLYLNYPKNFDNTQSFNHSTFNNTFNTFKDGDNELNQIQQEIIKVDQSIVPSAFNGFGDDNTNYSSIDEIDKLYLEGDNFHSESYTSLDNAFSIKQLSKNCDNRSIEQKLAEREQETDNLSNTKNYNDNKDFSFLDKI